MFLGKLVMTEKDLKKCKYNSVILGKDLKDGMFLIDLDDWEDPDSEQFVFEVSEVVITEEKVSFREVAYDHTHKRTIDRIHEIFRKPYEPQMRAFFPTLRAGLKLGIKLRDIEMT